MPSKDDINSILNAVNAINLRPKKKKTKVPFVQNFKPKLNEDLKISPDIDKLILEAEEYKKKSSVNISHVDLNLNKKNDLESKNLNNTLKEVKALVIEDLYSKSKKKIKKNTLKIIVNLRLKIKDLENQLENSLSKKLKTIKSAEVYNIDNSFDKLTNKDFLKKEITTSLLIQDSSISLLNKKVINFKKTEEELRFQIIDLQQDKSILLNKMKEYNESKDYKNKLNNTKDKLKLIYKQVEKQKNNFIDFTNYLIKIERDSIFFKENYEKLIVENNEIKKRLSISKEQIVAHENNKEDLLLSINQLNEILSKTNVSAKIISPEVVSKENVNKKKIEIIE